MSDSERDRMQRASDGFASIMDSLVGFIRTRIAADEQTAQAATPGPWEWDGHAIDAPASPTDYIANYRWVSMSGDDTEGMLPANGEHIARHDPARVLNQCTALSDLLSELERIAERSTDPDARITARSAMGRMALVWLTVDELDEKTIEWAESGG